MRLPFINVLAKNIRLSTIQGTFILFLLFWFLFLNKFWFELLGSLNLEVFLHFKHTSA